MRRLVALVVGAGLLLVALPASAEVAAGDAGAVAEEREALSVLARAVRAASSVDYRGTQRVETRWGTAAHEALVEVSHRPGGPAVVERIGRPAGGGGGAVVATAALDARRVRLLAAAYDLAVSGTDRGTGRATSVVEARRDDGQVAGRFWVDRATGLLLRREVHDGAGRRVRSSAFVELDVRGAAVPIARAAREQPVAAAADRLRDRGWRVPAALPGGFRLLGARLSGVGERGDVVHLAYSDGLSTTSLFVQRGELGTVAPEGFRASSVGHRPVLVRDGSPARVVWSGSGRVWTLVSDAPADVVRAAVASLPRDRAPDEGVGARLVRGLHRLGAALVPGG